MRTKSFSLRDQLVEYLQARLSGKENASTNIVLIDNILADAMESSRMITNAELCELRRCVKYKEAIKIAVNAFNNTLIK